MPCLIAGLFILPAYFKNTTSDGHVYDKAI